MYAGRLKMLKHTFLVSINSWTEETFLISKNVFGPMASGIEEFHCIMIAYDLLVAGEILAVCFVGGSWRWGML